MKKQLLVAVAIMLVSMINAQSFIERIENTHRKSKIGNEKRIAKKGIAASSLLKSSNSLRQADSLVFFEYSPNDEIYMRTRKTVEKKDSYGNVILEESYYWSGKWEGNSKYEYAYDVNGNQTLQAGYSWDSVNEDWAGRSKTVEAYDENDNQTLYVYYDWDGNANDWIPKDKEEYTLLANGDMTYTNFSVWDNSEDSWVIEFKQMFELNADDTYKEVTIYERIEDALVLVGKYDNFTYDTNGNMLSYLGYERADDTEPWVNCDKGERTYNADNEITEELYYRWDGSNWIRERKETYQYNVEGKDISESFEWDVDASDWVKNVMEIEAYDANDNSTFYERYYGVSNEWIGEEKRTFAFDSNDNITLEEYYSWDSNAGVWYGSSKNTFTYDSNGNVTTEEEYEWDSNDGDWVGYEKEEISYDTKGTFLLVISSTWDSSTSAWVEDGQMKGDNSYLTSGEIDQALLSMSEDGGGSWSPASKIMYHYSVANALENVATTGNVAVKAYPNPASDFITIAVTGWDNSSDSQITIYNISGVAVLKQSLTQKKQVVSTSELAVGQYIIKVTVDSSVVCTRLIIK